MGSHISPKQICESVAEPEQPAAVCPHDTHDLLRVWEPLPQRFEQIPHDPQDDQTVKNKTSNKK